MSRGAGSIKQIGSIEGFIDYGMEIHFSDDFSFFLAYYSFSSINMYKVNRGSKIELVKNFAYTMKITSVGGLIGCYYLD